MSFELGEGVKVEVEQDRLAQGVRESGIIEVTIEAMYTGKSPGGAEFVQIIAKDSAGSYVRFPPVYISSGNAKGNSYTYEDKKTKKQVPLPGFAEIDTVTKLAAGRPLHKCTTIKKKLNIWNKKLKAQALTEVDVIEDTIGKKINVGMLKIIDDKRANVAGDGEKADYQPTGETWEYNEPDKYFQAETGFTVSELVAKADKAQFQDKWSDLNDGKSRNIAKGAKDGAKAGSPAAAAGGDDLFDD